MPKLVITHAVENVERWLGFKKERADSLAPIATNVTDHVAMDGSKNVAVTMDVHDMDGAQALLSNPSPELVAAMDRHGVVPPLTAHVEK